MKRRRGNKKGKAKKPKLVSTNEVTSSAVSLNTDDNNNNNNNSGADESDNNNEEVDSGMDAETEPTPPQPEPTIRSEKTVNTDSIGRPINSTFGKAVYTRVKVKIKTSKNLDSQRASSDAPSLKALEAATKNAKLAASKKKEKSHYKRSPTKNTPSSCEPPLPSSHKAQPIPNLLQIHAKSSTHPGNFPP